MKGQISRYSWTEAKHFSAVYQVQGGMVTDADLGETSEIARMRTDQLGGDVVRSGVPAEGGVLAGIPAAPRLQPGIVYADGIRGFVAVAEHTALVEGRPFDLYGKQRDFPSAPPVTANTAGVYYADIWQHAVSPVEDPALLDVGLHGAHTSFRGKTMAQMRWAAATDAAAFEAEIGTRFPRSGNAVLTADFTNQGDVADPCDPCKETDEIAVRAPNALLRVEVVDVTGPANKPTRVELAWSLENAAEQYAVADVPEGFGGSGVFEYFSETTESHMGAFDTPAQRRRSEFVEAFPGAPNDPGWPFVRRWDGQVAVDLPGLATHPKGAGFQTGAVDGKLSITTDTLALQLDLIDKTLLAGDYWLVELREFSQNARPRVLNDGRPVGIEHHYCVLVANAADGSAVLPGDAARRRLSFPSLSDLPASHVSFDPTTCPSLFDGAENVQDALRNLCGIDAGDIGFDPNTCQVLYGNATTVQEALKNLCNANVLGNAGYREMFDWGVVCGLDVRVAADWKVTVTGGTFLDRSGRFVTYPGDTFDLNDQAKVKALAGLPDNEGTRYCLAIALDSDTGAPMIYVQDPEIAYGPKERPDLSFCQKVTDCQEKTQYWRRYTDFAIKPEDQGLIAKLKLATAQNKALRTTFELSPAEAAKVEVYVDTITQSFKAATPDAADFKILSDQLAAVRARYNVPTPEHFVPLETGKRAVDLLSQIAIYADDQLRKCVRNAVIVPCPPELEDKGPYIVPLGSLRVQVFGGKFRAPVVEITDLRKQALTLRAMRYRQGGGAQNDLAGFYGYLDAKPTYPYLPGELLASLTGFQRHPVFLQGDCLRDAVYRQGERIEELDRLVEPKKPWEIDPRTWLVAYVRPPIFEKPFDKARKFMTDLGAEVVNVVDVTQPGAMDELVAKIPAETLGDRLRSGEPVNPGDKIVMLKKGEDSVGYLVLEHGTRLPFEQQDLSAVTDRVALDLNERVKDARTARDAVVADLDQLAKIRDALVGDIEVRVKDATSVRDTAVADLDKTRAALQQQITEMKAQVETLAQTHATFLGQIEASKLEIAGAVKQRDAIITSMRAATPSTVLTTDAGLNGRMIGGGLTNVEEVRVLTDANMQNLVTRGVFRDLGEARRVRDLANTFVNRPIG